VVERVRFTFRNDWIRHQYLTLSVTRHHSDGSQTTSTVTDHYVPLNGTSEYALWANPLSASSGTLSGVVRVSVRVTYVRTSDANWQTYGGSVSGPTASAWNPSA
jgi:hypothetical protein